ncbi:MAG: hydroxymethylbilane synthase, partial [Candidatus Dormibacteraeota bacterium]|nr:hydroxymethylbilane synthase [Candidatus Dormibacteraeota bacterium]
MRNLRIGTRGSRLALIQAEIVAGALRSSGVEVEIVEVLTEGDRRAPDVSIGEGVFVAALERELAAG